MTFEVRTLSNFECELRHIPAVYSSYEWRKQITCTKRVCRNLTRPTLVKNLAKGIVDLCTSQESGEVTSDLRRQIVTSLIASLLSIESGTDAGNTAENVSKGLRKVSNFTTIMETSVGEYLNTICI